MLFCSWCGGGNEASAETSMTKDACNATNDCPKMMKNGTKSQKIASEGGGSQSKQDVEPAAAGTTVAVASTAAGTTKESKSTSSDCLYCQTLRPMAFGTIDSFENPKHFFMMTKGKGTNNTTIKSSSAVLCKEFANYETSLPIHEKSCIFVRALEDELDKVRVLIIGPHDTPYGYGCFLFDIFLDNYPNVAPKVQFLTTDSGRVRFNPNLYNCGKVCLSLLGTWNGPGWQPNKSTLLQLVVSLQGLVMGTSDPYFNEPGYETSKGTDSGKTASKAYNLNIRKETVRVAILPFLQASQAAANGKKKSSATTPPPFPEFQDIIAQHFKMKKDAIREQLVQWKEEDKSLETLYNQFCKVCDNSA